MGGQMTFTEHPGIRLPSQGGLFTVHFFNVPGTTRPRRLLSHWPVPVQQRVIGFSFQLAIIQHQFALHALGYCHLCKDALSSHAAKLIFGGTEHYLLAAAARARKNKNPDSGHSHRGTRTHDHKIKSLALYQLS